MSSRPYQLKDFKYNSHYWLLKFLSQSPGRLRILEIGTANGYLGAQIKNHHHWLVGVERECAWAEDAKAHYDVFHHADVENFDFPYRGEFDYILFADVLEHLRDPEAVLRRSFSCLKKSGQVIVSVPNVANFVIRMSLLCGRFEYAERGILDRTHLRFFTLASFHRFLHNAGCRILQTVATPLPVQLVLPITRHPLFAPLHEVHYLFVRLWKTLFAYQFVARAVLNTKN